MYRIKISYTILLLLAIFSINSCSKKIQSLQDLKKKNIGVLIGTSIDNQFIEVFPAAKLKFFTSTEDAIFALQMKKVDAVLEDEPFLRIYVARHDNFRLLDEKITEEKYAFAVSIYNLALKKTIDTTIDKLKREGIYQEIEDRWFSMDNEAVRMPSFTFDENKPLLLFGTSAITEPFSFLDEEKNIIGFDIELAHYVAKELDMNLEIVEMPFAAMIPSLISHNVDMIGGCITITDERANNVLFSEPNYQGGIGVLVRK